MRDQLEKQHREIISSVARQVKDLSDTSELDKGYCQKISIMVLLEVTLLVL